MESVSTALLQLLGWGLFLLSTTATAERSEERLDASRSHRLDAFAAKTIHGVAIAAKEGAGSLGQSRMVPGPSLGLGRCALIMAAVLASVGALWVMCKKIDCKGRKCDPRTWCKCIAPWFMQMGWDEFEGFRVKVVVHSIKDVANKSLLGGKSTFKVGVHFRWSRFMTVPSDDMRFEQVKVMEIPQGATECDLMLMKEGMVRDKAIGTATLETKRGMLDRQGFWGEKQNIKLEANSRPVGTLLITFTKLEEGETHESQIAFPGLSEDSALNIEMVKIQDEPNISALPQDHEKLGLLARSLKGNLREIDASGAEVGKSFYALLYCNVAELQGDKAEKVLAKAKEKAAKKGETEISRKWYWCWYKDEKTAENSWGKPTGFVPVLAITSVHRSPERNDQFLIKYMQGSKKEVLIYRRDVGKGMDVWLEGVELMSQEVRKMIKDKEAKEMMIKKLRNMHKDFEKKYGFPQTQEDWDEWKKMFFKQGFRKPDVEEFMAKVQRDGPRSQSEGKEGKSKKRGKGESDNDDDD